MELLASDSEHTDTGYPEISFMERTLFQLANADVHASILFQGVSGYQGGHVSRTFSEPTSEAHSDRCRFHAGEKVDKVSNKDSPGSSYGSDSIDSEVISSMRS